MSLYILDTDILTLFRMGNVSVVRRVVLTPPDNLAATVISVEEQLQGWYDSLRSGADKGRLVTAYDRLAETVRFYTSMNIISFSESAMGRYEALLKAKLNVRKYDLRIAAIALENNAVIVTRNSRDFGRVPGLTIEDWSV